MRAQLPPTDAYYEWDGRLIDLEIPIGRFREEAASAAAAAANVDVLSITGTVVSPGRFSSG